MQTIQINENLYKDLLLTDDKSVVQVICDTEVLKEIYELLRLYIMDADNFSNMVKMKYYTRLTEQIKLTVESNKQARELYHWLFNKDFESADDKTLSFFKNGSRLLAELRTLVKGWDDDDTDGELINEAMIAAFRFTRNISSNAS